MNWLFIFLGGGLGSISRHGLSILFVNSKIQWGILIVNALGGLGAGFLFHWPAQMPAAGGGNLQLALGVGFLGGFTTFSAFSAETIRLFNQQQVGWALIYVGLNVILSLGTCYVGYRAFA